MRGTLVGNDTRAFLLGKTIFDNKDSQKTTKKSTRAILLDSPSALFVTHIIILVRYFAGVSECFCLNIEMKYAVEENPDKKDISVMLLSVVRRSFSASLNFTSLTKSEN